MLNVAATAERTSAIASWLVVTRTAARLRSTWTSAQAIVTTPIERAVTSPNKHRRWRAVARWTVLVMLHHPMRPAATRQPIVLLSHPRPPSVDLTSGGRRYGSSDAFVNVKPAD